MRIHIVLVAFVVCYAVISIKVLSIVYFRNKENKYSVTTNTVFRKEIVDRNGNVLAVSLPIASLFANPTKMFNKDQAAEKLVKVLPSIKKQKLLSDLQANKNFVWVKHDLTPTEQHNVYTLGIPGVDFEYSYRRIYTHGNLLSHVIGYVDRDNRGLAGIERYFDAFLLDKGEESHKELQLSIDIRLQNIVYEELTQAINEFEAIGGVGIITDVKGEVLALVSKPDFNPQLPGFSKPEEMFNRASLGAYELGSIMKIIGMAIALDAETTTLHDVYNISGLKVSHFNVKDYHRHEGWCSVPEIFMRSSNIGMGQIALEAGQEHFRKYVKTLGLLDLVNVELQERAMPLSPSHKFWTDLTLVTMVYGYTLSISPLHFVQAVLPVVNGGLLYPLTLVKRENNIIMKPKRVFSESTSNNMNKLLRLVVSHGTGKRAEVPGFLVGGKTGTAEKLVGGHYAKNKRISSFVGVFPSHAPQYVVYIMLDEPKGNKQSFGFATGGVTSAGVVRNVISRIVATYGMRPYTQFGSQLEIEYKVNDDVQHF